MVSERDDDRLRVVSSRFYRGPNRWSALPAYEAEVAVDAPALRIGSGALDRLAAWRHRLEATPYEVAMEQAAAGLAPYRAGPAFDDLRPGAAEPALLWVFTSLLSSAGVAPRFAAWVPRSPSRFTIAAALDDEEVSAAALVLACKLLLEAVDRPSGDYDLEAELAAFAEYADDARLGPSTRAIIRAAVARGIPWRRVTNNSLCQLGEGVWRRRIWTAETDATGAIAEALAQDKQMTRMLLEQVGVPVPRGRVAKSVEEACAAARDLGYPVVVKPRDGNHGRGVSFGIRDCDDMADAFEIAINENHRRSGGVIVEQFARGVAHRLLVVGETMVAAARGQHDVVVGDGTRTIRALVEDANRDPHRGPNFTDILSLMKLDDLALAQLKRQSLSPDDVPEAGRRVTIKINGDLTTDETDEVCPDVARHMVLAAKAVGLDIAGIDLVAEDISRPLAEQRGMVIEVNAGPGMFMHIAPKHGRPRPVGEAIVELMFKEGIDGRVPVIVVGEDPAAPAVATSVAGAVAGFLRSGGIVAGLASHGTIHLPGQPAYERAGTDRDACIALLAHPHVEAVVLVSRAADAAAEGLGTLHCEVAVLAPLDPAAVPASARDPADVPVAAGDPAAVPAAVVAPATGESEIDALPIDAATATLLHALEPDGVAILDAAATTADAVLARAGVPVVLVDRSGTADAAARTARHRSGGGFTVTRHGAGAILASGDREHVLSASDLATVFADVPAGVDRLLPLAAVWAAGLLPGDRLMPPRPVTARLRFDAGGADA